jgi:hypothetical protein
MVSAAGKKPNRKICDRIGRWMLSESIDLYPRAHLITFAFGEQYPNSKTINLFLCSTSIKIYAEISTYPEIYKKAIRIMELFF